MPGGRPPAVLPGQMALDLFPAEPPSGADATCLSWLEGLGCSGPDVRSAVSRLFTAFGPVEGFSRAKVLPDFYGRRAVPALRGCLPLVGAFDGSVDYHTVWDRCWAARFVGLPEALRVAAWHYNYRSPYTGEPEWVWYTDVDGREVRRPYGEAE